MKHLEKKKIRKQELLKWCFKQYFKYCKYFKYFNKLLIHILKCMDWFSDIASVDYVLDLHHLTSLCFLGKSAETTVTA